MRKRISLSLPDKMIKSVDTYAEALSDTRSGAIESILQEYMDAGRYCVILAGGGDFLISDGENKPILFISRQNLDSAHSGKSRGPELQEHNHNREQRRFDEMLRRHGERRVSGLLRRIY